MWFQRAKGVVTYYRPMIVEPVYIYPPYFKVEGLHMLPSLPQLETYLVKVNLKDAYLTGLVAKGSQPLLALRYEEGNLYWFKILPFGHYTIFPTLS